VVAWEGDCEAILAALFHDALEEGGKPQGAILEVIQKQFGPAVATIVRSLSKPGAQAAVDKLRAELTYQQEILCASEHDRQPVMVKVADLIDNLDSLGYLPPERRIKFWAQVPAYYLPLTQAVAPGTVMVAELEAALRRSHPIFLQALEEISGSTLTVCIGEFSDRQEVVAPEAAKQSQPGLFHRLGQILTARL
jgi:(p)ppGpp synthase/HD superfamily hydrolase